MNKKVKNATPLEYKGIKFKSKLEVMIYKTLSENGFKVYYEPTKYVIWYGFKPTIPFYTKDKNTGLLKLDAGKIRNITYTPDFITSYGKKVIIIEAKGFQNDVYSYKRKLFRQYLEDANDGDNLYFEIYSKKQLLQAIDIIKSHDLDTEN